MTRTPLPTATRRSPRRRLAALTALIVPLLGVGMAHPADARRAPQPGDLDLSFGAGGTVVHRPPGYEVHEARSTLQPDAKVVVPGHSIVNGESVLRVTRFQRDGAVDATFGTGGSVTTSVGSYARGAAATVQPDGKIVVAGEAGPDNRGSSDLLVARYNPDGTLDPGFGKWGVVQTDVFGNEHAVDVALQRDGKIVVAGQIGAGSSDYLVARYTADGALDPTFGTGQSAGLGWVAEEISGGDDWASAMAIQPDGGIVVTGTTNGMDGGTTAFATARYRPDGSLDPTFFFSGVAFTDAGRDERGGEVALQSDGKIVIGGSSWPEVSAADEFTVIRYLADGQLDTADFDGGIKHIDIGVGADTLGDIVTYTVVLQGIEWPVIVAAGTVRGSAWGSADFGLVALLRDGSEWGFGTNRRPVTDFGGSDSALDLHLQGDRLVTVGTAFSGSSALAMTRHLTGEVATVQCPQTTQPCPGPIET